MVANVWVSSLIFTPSRACLASTAWCRPSLHCRPIMGRAGNDQGRARLVDQDVVHLVDDRVVERLLALVVPGIIMRIAPARRLHVVAQIVEAELAVRAVSDVAVVGLAPGRRVHVALDEAAADTQGVI